MKNLIKAVNKVMTECTTIDKSSKVGSGSYAYKGVKDSELKLMLSRSMRENGLAIFPTHIDESTEIERYTDKNGKPKMQVFTKVTSKFTLMHESGESIELSGIGHSVDNADKGAGKASTYAMKYALMYTFMVAAGEIDDADDYHSDEIEQPPAKSSNAIDIGHEKYDSAVVKVISGDITVDKIMTKYNLTKRAESKLREIENAE